MVKTRRVPWFITGLLLFSVPVILSIFPHWVTPWNPTQTHLADYSSGVSAPFPPSASYLLGSDFMGRDLLAVTLHGTFSSLYSALGITCLVCIVSILMAFPAILMTRHMLARWVREATIWVASLPALFCLILALSHRNLHSPIQSLQYALWIALFEAGRGTYAFLRAADGWLTRPYIEGAITVGRSRLGILLHHLRWECIQFSATFLMSEFARVMSLMAMLAAFHIYPSEIIGPLPLQVGFPAPTGILSATQSWFSELGDATNTFSFVSFPYFLYAPVLALVMTTVGVNLMAKAISER